MISLIRIDWLWGAVHTACQEIRIKRNDPLPEAVVSCCSDLRFAWASVDRVQTAIPVIASSMVASEIRRWWPWSSAFYHSRRRHVLAERVRQHVDRYRVTRTREDHILLLLGAWRDSSTWRVTSVKYSMLVACARCGRCAREVDGSDRLVYRSHWR